MHTHTKEKMLMLRCSARLQTHVTRTPHTFSLGRNLLSWRGNISRPGGLGSSVGLGGVAARTAIGQCGHREAWRRPRGLGGAWDWGGGDICMYVCMWYTHIYILWFLISYVIYYNSFYSLYWLGHDWTSFRSAIGAARELKTKSTILRKGVAFQA